LSGKIPLLTGPILGDGYLISTKLIDSLGINAKHFEPIPFDYHDSNPIQFYDDYGFDYGVMRLRPYYRTLLEANGVEALDEQVWKLQPQSVDFYFLLGIPLEFTKITENNIEFTPTFHPVEEVNTCPEGFEATNMPLFYGHIALGDLHDIGGMSGGPLFAFRQYQDRELKYWLTALQSKWLPDSHFIAACPTKILGDFIEEVLLQLVNSD
ncbi:MAG: hypothetical protein KJ069_20535, partial [Anaerolineae bacterium]|nr:hypothetical protein [Anaerolineae bacterium]